jgi:hypothetical protein
MALKLSSVSSISMYIEQYLIGLDSLWHSRLLSVISVALL